MSAGQKENIYVELREYHQIKFPKIMSLAGLEQLRSDFNVLEDKIINMLISLVNGRLVFVDHADELSVFRNKVRSESPKNEQEKFEQKLFLSKIERLQKVLSLGMAGNFVLKPERGNDKSGRRRLWGQKRLKE